MNPTRAIQQDVFIFSESRARSVARADDFGAGAPIQHPDHAVNPPGDGVIVGDDDDGHAELAVEQAQHVEDGVAGFGIDFAGRLVRQQQRGVIGDGDSDGDALLLAAAERARLVIEAVCQPNRARAVRGRAFLALLCSRH